MVQPQPKAKLHWRLLPIAYLDNFEKMASQFASLGLRFEDAIALRPSNPRFLNESGSMIIMPMGRNRSLKVKVEKSIPKMHLWLVGSQEITVSTLNAHGHCTAMAETSKVSRIEDDESYPEQSLTVDTRMAKVLHIDSKAPFVLTRFAIKHYEN
ncbi:MAG: hypothetical protein AAFY20_16495 [Cyanobacteria bacterium J06639_14]